MNKSNDIINFPLEKRAIQGVNISHEKWQVGDMVICPKFGMGIVKDAQYSERGNMGLCLTIFFKQLGIRTICLKYSKLKKM